MSFFALALGIVVDIVLMVIGALLALLGLHVHVPTLTPVSFARVGGAVGASVYLVVVCAVQRSSPGLRLLRLRFVRTRASPATRPPLVGTLSYALPLLGIATAISLGATGATISLAVAGLLCLPWPAQTLDRLVGSHLEAPALPDQEPT